MLLNSQGTPLTNFCHVWYHVLASRDKRAIVEIDLYKDLCMNISIKQSYVGTIIVCTYIGKVCLCLQTTYSA